MVKIATPKPLTNLRGLYALAMEMEVSGDIQPLLGTFRVAFGSGVGVVEPILGFLEIHSP